ncbi:IS66 family transposase [Sporosarcina trichiuri]|uniref:IS66 family transposase n=1 Tax=Sporosarcina trichiuri TaxID=3056445 RepID=UPI003D66CE2D
MANKSSNEKIIRLLEDQLSHSNEQIHQLTKRIESLTQQVQNLTKLLYGSKTEKSKYQAPDGQGSLFDEDESPFPDSEHTEEQSQQTISYTVVRKAKRKKRNDLLQKDIETEILHHHPEETECACCRQQMTEIGGTIVREEALFIPAKMKKVLHMEHAYECTHCKNDVSLPAQIIRGKAPQPAIQRSIAGPSVLAKVIYDKFIQYLPLYRQVKEWERHGLMTNDKNLSNWVISAADRWLSPLYERMRELLTCRNVLHVDETYAQVVHRSDGKSGQSKAFNWVCRTVPSQGPVMVLFRSALSRSRVALRSFISGYKGTLICDGYSAYGNLDGITFANCWAHVRRYWLKADSKNGRIGVAYCDQLYRLERKFRNFSPGKRRKAWKKYAKPIVDESFQWIEQSPFYGKSALATAAEYTLNRSDGLRAFLKDGRIEIDNNPAENAIRPNVIGRKNWLFSVSEAGAQANAICLSLAETAKIHGIDFYIYLQKLFTELPNLDFHQAPGLLDNYLPWSENIRLSCGRK